MTDVPAPLLEGARNCVRFGNVKPDEQVLLLAEPSTPQSVIELLGFAVGEAGGQVTVLTKAPTPLGTPLPPIVDCALKAADLVYDLGYPTVHSEAGFLASFDWGTRNLIVRPDPEALASEAARFPLELFYVMGKTTQAQVREQRQLRVTNDKGTDLRMEVVPGSVGAYIGPRPYEPGPAVPGYIGTFPPGTTVWGDLNYSATGTLVFDAAYHYLSPAEPIVLEIENGWVKSIEGGSEADEIRRLTEGIENATRFAECGFGLNPKVVRPRASGRAGAADASAVLGWTRKAGTFFAAMGGNTLMGGTDASRLVPIYGVVAKPTVTIGDLRVVDDGRLTLIAEPDPSLVSAASAFGNAAEVLREATT